MQRFRLCSWSGFGATYREEAKYHMLCEQDPCQSLDVLHGNGEGAFGSGLRLREVPTLHLGEQDHHLHGSCDIKVLALQEGREATTDTMGATSSRVRLRN